MPTAWGRTGHTVGQQLVQGTLLTHGGQKAEAILVFSVVRHHLAQFHTSFLQCVIHPKPNPIHAPKNGSSPKNGLSKALVSNSFLLLVVRHVLLLAWHLLLVVTRSWSTDISHDLSIHLQISLMLDYPFLPQNKCWRPQARLPSLGETRGSRGRARARREGGTWSSNVGTDAISHTIQ